ncbi:MAG: alanine:cation symporter family protein [Candidatus Azotimanducaceae bacterium WSBS_2022_MAG_OTU7]
MWMTAFFGMTTKFVEVTLSHKYRVVDDEVISSVDRCM